jgi:fimbrial chaperone protein
MRYLTQNIAFKIIVMLCITMLNLVGEVQANLLVAHTKITFDERERSKTINLINNTEDTLTYRIEWSEKVALFGGGYRVLVDKNEILDTNIASPMIRFSPRQVRLKAGERQTIALSLRRPSNMAEGEYRSHLSIKALPREAKNINKPGINLNLVISYSVPVVVRHGKPEAIVQIEKTEIVKNLSNNKSNISVTFSQKGLYSSYGNIQAYWKNSGTKTEKMVALINGYSIYPELDQSRISLGWIGNIDDFNQSGTLRVVYLGKGAFAGVTLAERSFQIDPSMIKTI